MILGFVPKIHGAGFSLMNKGKGETASCKLASQRLRPLLGQSWVLL